MDQSKLLQEAAQKYFQTDFKDLTPSQVEDLKAHLAAERNIKDLPLIDQLQLVFTNALQLKAKRDCKDLQ